MTEISLARTTDPDGLPPPLRRAQDAIHLPEVREMMRRLATYNLGVFMPHGHDDVSGAFTELPPDMMQVEKGMRVSFQPTAEAEAGSMLAVGWVWGHDGVRETAMCKMGCVKRPNDTMHYSEHQSDS